MSVPVAAGYPQYSGVDVQYIPHLYAPQMIHQYYQSAVAPGIGNTKYEGQIKKQGDSVIIRVRPLGNVSAHTKGGGWGTIVAPVAAPITLPIDNAYKYVFVVDDIDEVQADIVLAPEFIAAQVQDMTVLIDQIVFAAIPGKAAAVNKGATAGRDSLNINLGTEANPILINHRNSLHYMTLMGQIWDEQSVGDEGRHIVMPPWYRIALLNNKRLQSASIMGDDTSVLRNGRIGKIDRSEYHLSRNLLRGINNSTHIIGVQKEAFTFATQLVSNKVMENPQGPTGKLYSGVQVFGFEATLPTGIIDMVVAPDPADEAYYNADT